MFGAGYHVPLYALGDSMDFFASDSNVDSGVAAGVLDLQVSGKGRVFGARYNHNLPQWGDLTSTLIYGFDWRAYKNDIDSAASSWAMTSRSIRFRSPMPASGLSAYFNFQLTGLQNIPGGANSGDADLPPARRRVGQLQRAALRRGLHLAEGRLATAPAVQRPGHPRRAGAGEQFGAGGASSVRGFQ